MAAVKDGTCMIFWKYSDWDIFLIIKILSAHGHEMPLKEAIWIDVVASTKTPFTPFRRTGYVRLCFKLDLWENGIRKECWEQSKICMLQSCESEQKCALWLTWYHLLPQVGRDPTSNLERMKGCWQTPLKGVKYEWFFFSGFYSLPNT